jgi:hypothetical protein
MRDRLYELLKSKIAAISVESTEVMGYQDKLLFIANHLIAAGVIVPPCKVGDTVYVSNISCMPCHKITEAVRGKAIRYVFNAQGIFCVDVSLENGFNWRYSCNDFGKFIFLTREEAEKALAERSGENAD